MILARLLQINRYMSLKIRERLFQLDRNYHGKPKASKYRTVVTLSTIPERVKYLGPTLASILDQTVKVDEIAINIPYVSRKGKKYRIPGWFDKLENVTIHRVDKDEGPATKLLPAVRRESKGQGKHQTRIIAIDDDNIYNSRTLEILLSYFDYYNKDSNKVAISNYGILLRPDGRLPLFTDRFKYMFMDTREVDLLQGFSGFVITPDMLPKESLEIKNCPKEAISVDDIWFSGWLHLNGVKIISPAFMYRHLPIVNFGEIRLTPALAFGENAGFVSDQIVIDWFVKEKGMIPVRAR